MIKKALLGAVALAVAGLAPAFAQTTYGPASPSINVPISGVLPKACQISSFVNGPLNAINLSSTTVQGAESATVTCNYGGSATVAISSANGGALKRSGGSETIAYNFFLSGSPFSSGVSLASTQTWTGWPAVVGDQTRSYSVQLASAAVVAGTYEDTLTFTVTPN